MNTPTMITTSTTIMALHHKKLEGLK